MKIFQNKALWIRGAVVVSVVWIGLLVIAAQLNRDFRWFGYEWQRGGDLGPASVTALVGVVLIWVVALGLPWVAEAGAARR